MSKHYTISPTNRQLEKIKHWWKLASVAREMYWKRIGAIERQMSKDVGVKDMELFHLEGDGSLVGVGNYNRTMKLIQRETLES